MKMIPALLPAAALILGAASAEAGLRETAPEHVWQPGQVIEVLAGRGFVTTIELDPGERIESYASGFSSAWELAAEGRRLYLKPRQPKAATNLAVSTSSRTYLFSLKEAQAPQEAIDCLVRVKRPPEPGSPEQLAKQRRDLAAARLAKPLTPEGGARCRAWRMNFGPDADSRRLAPLEAQDDGLFTYLRLAPEAGFPAVFRKDADGEAIAGSHVEPDGRLVIHGVYPELRLRAGRAVVGLYRSEAACGRPSGSAGRSAAPGLVRTLLHASEEHIQEESHD